MDKHILWLIYTSIVSFQYHPGTKQRMSPWECAADALSYYTTFKLILEDPTWHGSEHSSQQEQQSTET